MIRHHRKPVEIIRFQDVGLYYPNGHPVFHKLNFSFHTGGFYFLTGVSGAGKTSFLKLIYKELLPTEGKIQVFGRNLAEISKNELSLFRQKMGLVFQDCRLLPHLSILDNVALPLVVCGIAKPSLAKRHAKELLNWVGLGQFLDFLPSALSDGQKQRVGIARAVITRPLILLADEPTGNVDDKNAHKLMMLFEEMQKLGTTVIIATHNQQLLKNFHYPEINIHQGSIYLKNSLDHEELYGT